MKLTRVVAPSDLSAASKALFVKLSREYEIRDAGGREILRSGLLSLDRAVLAEATVAADGMTTKDRFGQTRAHPLLTTARDFRAQWLAALRLLNLSIGETPKIGRPEGS